MKVLMITSMLLFIFASGCADADRHRPKISQNGDVEILCERPSAPCTEVGRFTVESFGPSDTAKMHDALRSIAVRLEAEAVWISEQQPFADQHGVQRLRVKAVMLKYGAKAGSYAADSVEWRDDRAVGTW